jgi:purine-nucleoside phosphorylase
VITAVDSVARWLGGARPSTAIVLGSGLGGLTNRLAAPRRLPYRDIPGFPASHVAGHEGALISGTLGGIPVLCQSGRFHAYEGHAPETVALPVRVFAALGIRTLMVTNAAGGIAARLSAGALMLLSDLINLTFTNPLHGPVRPGESRFPDLSAPFDPQLTRMALAIASQLGLRLEHGVYAGVMGPSYETPAEIGMLRRCGADAVGMSTVQEVIAARANGLRCLGISVITNRAAGLSGSRLSHEEVLAASAAAAHDLERLLAELVPQANDLGAASTAGTL